MSLTNRLLELGNDNPKEFWNQINRMRSWGREKDDAADRIGPQKWTKHFENLFGRPTEHLEEQHPSTSGTRTPIFNELNYSIKQEEVRKAINQLKKNKSTGFDNIINEFLIAGKDVLTQPLLNLFNLIFSRSTYPKLWTINLLKPIHKKGDPRDPDNYRGIAVSSCLSKLFSYVLLNRLQVHVGSHNLIAANQIGFSKGKRTSDHIFVLKRLIDDSIKRNKGRLFVAFIDFQKAYDSINRNLLIQKLYSAEIGGLFLDMVKSMYKSVCYSVKINGKCTNPIESGIGLKQGCVLSPLLFNIFIDDIKKSFDPSCEPVKLHDQEISHLLYADDLILISKSSEGLQSCLLRLHNYCKKWQLTVNHKKSKAMIFNASGKVLQGFKFVYDSRELELVQDYTYLGIDISASGSFSKAISSLTDKANKAMHPLIDTIKKFNLGVKMSMDLFSTLIKPILLYGSEVWTAFSNHQLTTISDTPNSLGRYLVSCQIEKTNLKFCKRILGVKRNCPSLAIYGELGNLPLLLPGLLRNIKFWHRLTTLHDNSLIHKAFKEELQAENPSNWLQTVKITLGLLGLQRIFENPHRFSSDQVSRLCKENMKNYFLNLWKHEIEIAGPNSERNSKLRTYKIFGTNNLEIKKYLTAPLRFKDRQRLTKFRCSDHNLEIEVGRHKGVEVNDRQCQICDLHRVEDEAHFLCECPAYAAHREVLYKVTGIINSTSNEAHFQDLMQSNEPSVIEALSNFLKEASDIRRNHHGQ